MGDDQALLTLGRLARRTGTPVRTIRYWSDIGALPRAGRSGGGGYRLYDAASVARLELIRTLRELGLGLEDVRRVLERETTVAAVAAVHVEALDGQIRTPRLRSAVLGSVAKRQSDTAETTPLNQRARLSADERGRIAEEFVEEVFEGLDSGPDIEARMRRTPADLSEDPAPNRSTPGGNSPNRSATRTSAATCAPSSSTTRHSTRRRVRSCGSRARSPASSASSARRGERRRTGRARVRALPTALLDADADRAAVPARLGAGTHGRAERHRQLPAVLADEPPRPTHVAEFRRPAEALGAHPRGSPCPQECSCRRGPYMSSIRARAEPSRWAMVCAAASTMAWPSTGFSRHRSRISAPLNS